MKIILQPEARTVSNQELANNQQYLINLFAIISQVRLPWRNNRPSSSRL